jgi:hypothetical protein
VEVVLSCDDQNEVHGELRDVAIQGIFVTCSETFALDTVLWFRIILHGGLDDIEILGKGQVVRIEDEGVAIHFTAIDPESVPHLRNLIALNAEDPSEAWDEMRGNHGARAAGAND